jgi:hypothetical protein
VYGSTVWLPTVALVLALMLAALGFFPDQEHALYLTAVGLGLFMSAMGLFVMVFERRRPQPASDLPAIPATRGSSA